jgi:tripartite-type tricarboxylate transporter receptor subunit TctC
MAGVGIRHAAARAAFPSHALTLIVPFAPGTSVGINARLLQPHLERALGQTIQLEFDQGAGGLAGHLAGAEAAADGYTLTMISASLTTQPWISRVSVARPDDFAFIGQVTSFPSVLLVRSESPLQTLAELVAALRASPESLTTGQLVGWWPPALAQAALLMRAGIKPRVVSSYYSGADLVVALAQAQLDFVVVGLADVRPSLNGGTLRALAVSGHTRTLPATPSFREQGWDVTQAWWRGLAAPKDTPAEVVGRLSAALREALDSRALRADFSHNGLSVDPLDGPEFRQFVQDEYSTLGALFTSLGLNVRTPKPM